MENQNGYNGVNGPEMNNGPQYQGGYNYGPAAGGPQPQYNQPYYPPYEAKAENILKIFAYVILVLGVILAIISIPTAWFVEHPSYYSSHKEFNPAGMLVTAGVIIWTLVTWASIMIFVNISITLKQINSKIR